jgi:ABC-type multidrug transport system ATPase subunit
MKYAIQIQNLSHNHAGENALRGVTMRVPQGSLFGIIGADGAGKSTLFRILSTLLKPQHGKAQVLEWDVLKEYTSIRSAIGYMPQRFSLYQDLTVLDNLRFSATIMDIPEHDIAAVTQNLMQFSRLESAKNRRAGRLSGGMKQKLALCCALVRKPKMMLLDEPTVGVDPVTRKEFWEMLAQLKAQGTTTVVSTPYMDEAELCDEVMLLHEGQIVGLGTPAELCGSLPGKLWRIYAEETLHITTNAYIPPPLFAVYAMGGGLHVLAPLELSPVDVFDHVKQICPLAKEIEPAKVRVEDVLLHALREVHHG